jgi:arabinogalactan oligomer / maltooligosaccharide transport system permease protein
MPTATNTPGPEHTSSGPGRGSFAASVRRGSHPLNRFGDTLTGIVVKLMLLAAVDGAAIYMVLRMVALDAPWYALAMTIAATIALNWIYIGQGRLPAKYLIPGTIFLLIFQIYPFAYTFYIAFTNYGTGQILTQEQAIHRIETASIRTLPGAERFAAVPLADGDDLGLLLTDEAGEIYLGTPEDGLVPVDDLEVERVDDRITVVDGYERQSLGAAQDRIDEYTTLRIPVEDGEVQLISLTSATQREQTRFYDPDTGTLTDVTTDTTYRASERGRFVSEDGEILRPGWRVVVGTENFVRAFTNEAIRGPFLRIMVWTYIFAFMSTLLTFAVGLGLAITLNDPRVKGRKLIRLAMIVPYALPTFMTALIWRGMMNRRFGVLNDIIGYQVPWLNDPMMARVSVLLVNLWFGFPYMFLICSAALQSIPGDIYEAASVDGAGGLGRFRRITLPLLLVATAPVLISTFAFNFNNFNVIYLLTGGNPPIAGSAAPAGHTDILISYTYRIAFESGGGQDYGLGATVAILTFILVAIIAVASFKWMRPLEEVHE